MTFLFRVDKRCENFNFEVPIFCTGGGGFFELMNFIKRTTSTVDDARFPWAEQGFPWALGFPVGIRVSYAKCNVNGTFIAHYLPDICMVCK